MAKATPEELGGEAWMRSLSRPEEWRKELEIWGKKTSAPAYDYGYYLGMRYGSSGAEICRWSYDDRREEEEEAMGIADAIGDWWTLD